VVVVDGGGKGRAEAEDDGRSHERRAKRPLRQIIWHDAGVPWLRVLNDAASGTLYALFCSIADVLGSLPERRRRMWR
jgi:hypothetical protein